MKPFLKWPGGKYRQVDRIGKQLNGGLRLVEPFVGSAAVFLNTDYRRYLLADNNLDLINLYRQLQEEGQTFIDYCRNYFSGKLNQSEAYYQLRKKFNLSRNRRLKSALFLYLNRHGYNGLCRYNQKGTFNVPFGRYDQPYFPEKEMQFFHTKSRNALFINAGFHDTMKQVRKGDVVYCDPPYAPLNTTARFTDYSSGGFNWQQQVELAEWANKLSRKGIQVVISNHDIQSISDLYQQRGANMDQFRVRRTISCHADNRVKVGELIAVFEP
ncbi:MAG: Dam family site-specific DNA-(adenine-N6)-methyltransferase [Gammaproteobacteria bacterium]|nr:Dam family site-specific DNA-(adenine-N6)-methyltransferase [Gammaproteobacteria bacterium]NIN61454.1 Dam family site-specific DNA-(adenine-N6)-methyltransferase [Gammaproteobacteria bacterium]NIO61221.1 Dam family site-specific DNA-(adenine-N6)-methyltransferase [Gammaproteobacteria bacterium]NIP48845.1 Dam family site-specific DNA-(adenine-N6)-methyltransferase [Gammaproteobacteria bacterium]NIQ09299.1 Dam family site-specific DNA-(adenine-N6)-methyltransferase [Gammaproteobacteria bacteri